MKNIIHNSKQYLKVFFLALVLVGCEDFLETAPSTQVSDVDAFKTTETTSAVLKGIIRDWRSLYTGGEMSMSGLHGVTICREVMGPDVLVIKSHWRAEVSYSAFTQTFSRVAFNWSMFYRAINNVNNVLANVDAAQGTQAEKDQIRGVALALRGYSYFELVNTYAPTYSIWASKPGVPIYLEPTNGGTAGNPRATVQEVYDQILDDLNAAKALLTTQRSGKAYININVVNGFLARVYLMMGDYALAATSASAARIGYPLMSRSEWTWGFNEISNQEWIWGQDNNASENPDWGSVAGQLDCESGGGEASLHASNALYNLYAPGDWRNSVFYNDGGYWGSRKFLVSNPVYAGDYPYMRGAEMYLIEAEALARTGNEPGARTLLFELQQNRDPSAVSSGNTGQALINEILTEKRKEFWGEGIYFMDMLRLSMPLDRDPLHNTQLDLPANSWAFIFQIPEPEFLINTSLDITTDQNPSSGIFTK
jgi:hypothetical protein